MRYLICGLGSIGRRHVRNLITLGEQDLVYLRSGKSASELDDLPDMPVETDIDESLDRWNPGAVIICTPTALHFETAIPAASRGCHLLLEKPISHSREGVEELREAVHGSRAKVLVGYQFRYHPGLIKIKELLEDQAIGAAYHVVAHWGEYLPDWHPGEDFRESYSARLDLGGGVLLTLNHPFDYLRWLLGEVRSLYAKVDQENYFNIEVDQSVDLVLQFDNGVSGNVHLDYLQRPSSHSLRIAGQDGLIRWDAARGGVDLYRVKEDKWELWPGPNEFDRNNLFLEEMRHFIAVASGEEASRCTLDDGIHALDISLLARQSSQEGRALDLI